MALANSIPQVVFYLTLFPFFMSRVLQLSYGRIMITSLFPAIFAVAVSAPVALLMRTYLPPLNWETLAADVLFVAVVAMIPAYYILERDDRRKFTSFFIRKK
jgi:hypothetical protein